MSPRIRLGGTPRFGCEGPPLLGTPACKGDELVNVYLIAFADGSSREIQAEFYEESGDDYVFFAGVREVLRVRTDKVKALTKTPLR